MLFHCRENYVLYESTLLAMLPLKCLNSCLGFVKDSSHRFWFCGTELAFTTIDTCYERLSTYHVGT